ncbi:MAG: SRPBCC family protein [Acidimicrobiia bacterium]
MTRTGSGRVELPSDTEILITRAFDAPAELVFEVWTNPQHVRNWWASPEDNWLVCDIDLREGGHWRYVVESPVHGLLGWHGEYRSIEHPHRMVSTEVFEGYPDAEAIDNLTLVELDGVTTMTVLVQHSSNENRDGHLNAGMEGGLQLALNRVDQILQELKS